jgi:hypothetical protein
MPERETPRLYSDLAWLWPLWGSPDGDYAEWCAYVAAMIEKHAKREVKTLLNLGYGGGRHSAVMDIAWSRRTIRTMDVRQEARP